MVTENYEKTVSEESAITFFSEAYDKSKYNRKKNVKSALKIARNPIRDKLKKQYEERKEHPVIKVRPESERIRQLREELANISTIRKERVFDSEPTEEEKLIIQKRVTLQQLQYQEYEKRDFYRKFDKINDIYDFVSEEEVKEALEDSNKDEDQVILNFTQQEYLPKIRKIIALKYNKIIIKNEMSNEQREAYERFIIKRKRTVKKITSEDAKTRYTSYSRLRLDDALNQLKSDDPSKAFEGWSEARLRAYKMIETKPNTYYYRFNAPGEKQRNGAWTTEEKKSFMKRLKEVGADGQWGLFSMSIPGRVGYQCSNFYRHLLKTKQIEDPNYIVEENGKMHYLFGKKDGQIGSIRKHSKHGSKLRRNSDEGPSYTPNSSSSSTSINNATHTRPKRKRKHKKSDDDETYGGGNYNDDDDFDDYDDYDYTDTSGTYRSSWSTTKRSRARLERRQQERDENPLPGFTDPITLEEVLKPAISPYGHVMGYDSWVRCLNNKDCRNICPITKKPLTKRELVILTYDNIDLYR